MLKGLKGILEKGLQIAAPFIGASFGGPWGSAIGTGIASLLTGNKPKDALMAAGTGYLGGKMGFFGEQGKNPLANLFKKQFTPSQRQPGLFESEPGLIPDEDAEFYEYPDERYLGMLNRRDPYEGIYQSPLTDTLYGEELVDATPKRPLHSKHEYLPRDTVAIESMGGGMNAFPEQGWADWFLGRDPSMDITEDLEEEYVGPKGRFGLYNR